MFPFPRVRSDEAPSLVRPAALSRRSRFRGDRGVFAPVHRLPSLPRPRRTGLSRRRQAPTYRHDQPEDRVPRQRRALAPACPAGKLPPARPPHRRIESSESTGGFGDSQPGELRAGSGAGKLSGGQEPDRIRDFPDRPCELLGTAPGGPRTFRISLGLCGAPSRQSLSGILGHPNPELARQPGPAQTAFHEKYIAGAFPGKRRGAPHRPEHAAEGWSLRPSVRTSGQHPCRSGGSGLEDLPPRGPRIHLSGPAAGLLPDSLLSRGGTGQDRE